MKIAKYSTIIISALLLNLPLSTMAEEIQIDSIQSTQGAGIICSANMKGTLTLMIMGETGKRTISVTKRKKYLFISDKNIYYSNSIYENAKNIIDVLELSRNMYFDKGHPIEGTTGIEEYNNSLESYNILNSIIKTDTQPSII